MAALQHYRSLSVKVVVVSGVLISNALSAFPAGNPCEGFTPTNFKHLSLEKKIQISEAIRECERKLMQKSKDGSTTRPKDTRTLAYINPSNRLAQ
jgi:hypothetical protein